MEYCSRNIRSPGGDHLTVLSGTICRKDRGDVIAYQIRQSFKPGEITPEEANQVGYELAMSFTKGEHAFIVATHTDRAHIHNHVEYRKHGYSKKFYEAHREELTLHKAAKEYFSQSGLQKLPKVKDLNQEYAELLNRKKGAYSDYRYVKDEMKKYNLARRNVETFLEIDQQHSEERVEKKPEKAY